MLKLLLVLDLALDPALQVVLPPALAKMLETALAPERVLELVLELAGLRCDSEGKLLPELPLALFWTWQ